MINRLCITFILFALITPASIYSQSKGDPEKIKSQKIRSVKKVSTDLKASDNFTPKTVSIITYDEHGNQSEFIKYNDNGDVEMIFKYLYDEKGNTIEVTGLQPNGKLGNKWSYQYDEKNNLVRQTSYRPDGSIGRDYIFTYDEKGIRESELIYDNKQLIEQAEYIYEFYEGKK